MSNWNEGYTRKKQKQMVKDATEREKKRPPTTNLGIYGKPPNTRREEERKEKFAWRIGIGVMIIISILGIYGIWWAATL